MAPRRAARRRLKILITAGPTREYIDTVRFLSNPSSGRMGYALAAAAARRGHAVTLVSGPVDLPTPRGVTRVAVVSAEEMLRAAARAFARCDAAVFCAAVCDYRPRRRAGRKLPKRHGVFRLELEPTPDIAAELGTRKGRRAMIGFALEDHAGRAHAEGKLTRKNFDAIALNSPAAIGADRAQVDLLRRGGGWQRWPALTKPQVALRLIRLAESLCGA